MCVKIHIMKSSTSPNFVQEYLHPIPEALRNGLVMVIQVLLIGSFATLLEKLHVAGYQNFIHTFAGGTIYNILAFIDRSTLGMLSVYMTISVSISYVRIVRKNKQSASFACSATVLACFFIMVGFYQSGIVTSVDGFYTAENINRVKELLRQVERFSGRGMFSALVASIVGSVLFTKMSNVFRAKTQVYADGTDSVFHSAMATLLPSATVILIFALFNYVISVTTGCSCVQDLFVAAVTRLFEVLGENRSFFSGFLFLLLSQIMWCFGIHGSNVLEQVSKYYFEPINEYTGIVSKSFMDNFAIMGGCGTTLALLIAIFIFSKRTTTRRLSRLSLIPGLFNINELMVFGLPIVYNFYLILPFVCVPLVMYTLSYLAVSFGFVPAVSANVHWTTPVVLSGYYATGSFTGSILQLINLAIGVAIYRPFILWYDKKSDTTSADNLKNLVGILKESEANLTSITLTELKSPAGILAKSLVNDLSKALEDGDIQMKYQPQYSNLGKCVGVEALLRWNHPYYGMMYPPLAVKLAKEAGLLWKLEKFVMSESVSNLDDFVMAFGSGFKLSFNVTVSTFNNPEFIPFLESLKEKYKFSEGTLCVEITEEMALDNTAETSRIFARIKELGFKLALDDFSMGHTSLQYLQNNPFDIVKIDGNLVKEMLKNSRCRDIIASIIYLSNSLGFDVIAEFVETMEEKKVLEEIGCKIYQGYLFSPAVDVSELV